MKYEDERLTELSEVLPFTAHYLADMQGESELLTTIESAVHELSLRYRAALLINGVSHDGVVHVMECLPHEGKKATPTPKQIEAVRRCLPNTAAALEHCLPNTAAALEPQLNDEVMPALLAVKELCKRSGTAHLRSTNKVDVTWLSEEDMYDTLGYETMAALETGDTLMFKALCSMDINPFEGARSIFTRPPAATPFGDLGDLPGDAELSMLEKLPRHSAPRRRGLLRRLWDKVLWWLWRIVSRGRGNRTERQNAQERK